MSGKSHRSGQYGEESTSKIFYYDPDKLVLVDDKNDPLYDERVHNKPDESMVLNIMSAGVYEPVIVKFDGVYENGFPIVKVIDGKQRTINSREGNKRLRAAGKEPVFVPCIVKKVDQATAMGIMISTNEIRKEDSQMNRVRKLKTFMSMGRSVEQASVAFGVSKPTIKNWLDIGEMHPDVQAAIDDGMPTNVARELKDLPQAEQPVALEKLKEAGTVKGARGVQAAKSVRAGKTAEATKVRMMARPAIEAWRARLKKMGDTKDVEVAYAILSKLLGHERSLANFPRLKESFEETEEK